MTQALVPEFGTRLEMRPSAALVARMELLALPEAALTEAVERELAANPALERDARPARRADPPPAAAAESSAAQQLLADARLLLAPRDHAVAAYVVACLDEHGFLRAPERAGAVRLAGAEAVGRVVCALREAGPPSVAARDLRECLLLQLERRADVPAERLARAIVDRHLAAAGAGAYAAIATALGTGRADVAAAVRWIGATLNPRPLDGSGSVAVPLRADVVVRGDLAVELAEGPALVVSPAYEQARRALPPGPERAAVDAQIQRGREFIARLQARRRTVRDVAAALVRHQAGFVRDGRCDLLPLTRAQLARELGLHESTVGRAVAGRAAQLPDGRVVPLRRMFPAPAELTAELLRLLDGEDRPRSDAELAHALAARGLPVARRTVAKHRARLGIAACSAR